MDSQATPSRRRLLPTRQELNILTEIANNVTGSGVHGTHTPAAAYAKLLAGFEHGLPPSTALNELRIMDGRITIPEMVAVAAIRAGGLADIRTVEVAADHATVAVTRADWPPNREERVTFGIPEAVAAGLAAFDASGKNISRKDNWRKAFPQMCLARARAEAKRRWVEEEAAGLAYSPDELGAETDEDGRVVELAESPGAPGLAQPGGNGSGPAPAPPWSAPTASTQTPPSQAPAVPAGCAAVEAPDSAAAPTPAGPPAAPPAPASAMGAAVEAALYPSEWQQNRIRELIKELGADKAGCLKMLARYNAQKIAGLSVAQADEVIEFLDTLRKIELVKPHAGTSGMSPADWAKCLARRNVTQAIELQPGDAKTIYEKLSAMLTPLKRQELGLEPTPAGAITGNPLSPLVPPAPSPAAQAA